MAIIMAVLVIVVFIYDYSRSGGSGILLDDSQRTFI